MIVLGIETTCDETAAAVVERFEDGRGKILSNVILSQVREHAAFGGVVPEIAARAHVETLDGIIGKAMAQANCGYDVIDGDRRCRRSWIDRWGHRRPDNGEGNSACEKQAADRRQSP